MMPGKLYESHVDLFPEDKDDPKALEKRRANFVLRAGQVFEDENIAEEVRHSIPLQHLFDLWTNLGDDNDTLDELVIWYDNWRHFLKYQDRLAVVFFGTFTIETLNINVRPKTLVKEAIAELWEYHDFYIEKISKEDINIFLDRIKLMCEAPLLPGLIKDEDDFELRKTAYMHYGDSYNVPETDKALLESYAEQYAKVIVANDIDEVKKLLSKRSSTKKLEAMWKDVIETFNLSRRFHASVFGGENIRPLIPVK